MALRVRTCRPGRSGVRSSISSCARLLNATRLTATGRQVPDTQQVPCPFGQHTRLARAGGSDDSCSPLGMGHRGELIGGEIGVGDVRTGRDEGSVLDRRRVQDRNAVDRIGVADRTRIEPHHVIARSTDVARLIGRRRSGSGCHGVVESEPGRCLATEVDRVGPHEMVQFLQFEGEVGADFEGLRPRSSASARRSKSTPSSMTTRRRP